MAIKKISEFTSGIPTASDMILFEQSGAGKSTSISNAVNTCSLTLEEIQASTDLTGKVASASALKDLNSRGVYKIYTADTVNTVNAVFPKVAIGFRLSGMVLGNLNGTPFFTNVILFTDGRGTNGVRGDSGIITVTDNGDGTATVTIGGMKDWGKVNLIVFYT